MICAVFQHLFQMVRRQVLQLERYKQLVVEWHALKYVLKAIKQIYKFFHVVLQSRFDVSVKYLFHLNEAFNLMLVVNFLRPSLYSLRYASHMFFDSNLYRYHILTMP